MNLNGTTPPDKELCNEHDALLPHQADGGGHHSYGNASSSGEEDPQKGPFKWLSELKEAFGFKHLVLLVGSQHLLKGFVDSFTTQAEPYIYKDYQVPAPQMQVYQGVTMLPWALKPIIGLLSDVLPVAGYNKAPYLILTTVLGVIALLFVGLAPSPKDVVPVQYMILCFFLVALMISTVDLLTEAKYAEKMQRIPAKGPALLTFVWFGLNGGQLAGTLLSGPFIDSVGPSWAYFFCAGPAALFLVPVMLGYVEESYVSSEEVAKVQKRFLQEYETCGLCLVMFLASSGLVVVGMCVASMATKTFLTLVAFLAVLGSFSVVLSPVIAKFNAFSLIQSALSLRISAASYYFYTDSPAQYPEGPHFSPYFYNTVMGATGAVVSLVGIATYQRYLSGMPYRSLLVAANVGMSIFSLLDAVIFARLNRSIGIPDSVFVLGSSVLEGIIHQWQWMPQVVILSYFCPRGMEATMYALLAGCHNLGNTISATLGAWLLDSLSIAPSGRSGESEQFEHLWVASLVTSVIPLVTVLLLFWLVPDVRQSQRVLHPEQSCPTEGSLFRRWFEPAA